MASSSIKSSFFVRKSSRLSSRKKGLEEKNDSSVEEPTKRSPSVTSAIKNVFQKKDKANEGRNEESSPLRSSSSPRASPSSVMGSCCGRKSSSESVSLIPSTSPSKDIHPDASKPLMHSAELSQACRRLLSPSKRKSDDENEYALCNISPVKSPRSSPDESSPVKPGDGSRHGSSPSLTTIGQTTPKSCSKLNSSRSSKVPTSTPRRLFSSPEKNAPCAEELTPQKSFNSCLLTPESSKKRLNKQNTKMYQSAKRCLHTAKPDRLIGRDKEIRELEDFVSERLEDMTSGSLYISGPPGTGKTAVISHVVESLKSKFPGLKCAFINCMTLRDANAVFCQTYEMLQGSPVKGRDAMKSMEKLVTAKANILIVLDEIDQLDSKHQDVLYSIFEWPALKNSKLVLVGIANALDLTDRVLPRLQASAHCRPTLMNFAPYTSVQITDILKHRLERECVVEPGAINFCARKISAVAGDMRKALDVCRRAVEIVEGDVKSQTVLKSQDCNSPTKKSNAGCDTPLKKVTLAHICQVMNEVYGSNLNKCAGDGVNNTVPLQQKLVVCSLLVLLRTGKLKEVLLGKLHEAYSRVCRKQQVACVDQAEFLSMLNLLDSRGIVALKKAKDTRSIKISLKLDEQELASTLQDKFLLASILKDGIPK
ncbi:cell division control protein 6 homolog [Plakobranchus ocellatus]|uniref:Cell division control protein n=1 Tax=Plakobranchus ocellatus TaxID=259542 RepID=A0AAV4CMX1_9GAST|nr:cell division control protein 6 homolog [Plakobranchus ocellatus]